MRGGALGDFVLTLPAIAALRPAFPGHALRLIGRPDFLRLARPDYLLDQDSADLAPLYLPGGSLPPATLAFFAEVRFLLVYAVDPDQVLATRLAGLVQGEVLLHNPHPPPGYHGHIAEYLLAPLRHRGLDVPDSPPCLHLRPQERSWVDSCWRDLGLGPRPVLVHPGSGGRHKCWPLASYLELVAHLQRRGIAVLLIQGPAEADRPLLSPPCPVLHPPGALELASLLERAALFVGNDSGPGHLTAALGRPVLALFGPTDPRIWRPCGPRCRVLQAPGGRMAALAVEVVLETALEMLEEAGDG